MSQITIFGATGMVGKNLTQKIVKEGHEVKVLVRNKEKLNDLVNDIEVIEGDYFDTDKLQDALEGAETVISTVGPPLNKKLSKDEEEKYISSLAFIIEAMEANKQKRWLNIAGAGIKTTNEDLPLACKLLRVMIKSSSKSIINVKDKELEMLKDSQLDWTSIRPPHIRANIEGEFIIDEIKYIANEVNLDQLTDFMLKEIKDRKWVKKSPIVGTKKY